MRRSRAPLLLATLGLLLSLALAPAALADAFDRIFKDYQSTGKINACKYSEAELKQAKGEVPNDIEAYAPDFPNALQSALEQRAGGACGKGGQQIPGAPPATAGPAGPGQPGAATAPAAPGATVTPSPDPAPTASPAVADQAIAGAALGRNASDAEAPAPVVALGVLGALLALAGLAYGLAHWLAWDPRWARSARHAFAEAGWRAGNTWSEFADWVRLGR